MSCPLINWSFLSLDRIQNTIWVFIHFIEWKNCTNLRFKLTNSQHLLHFIFFNLLHSWNEPNKDFQLLRFLLIPIFKFIHLFHFYQSLWNFQDYPYLARSKQTSLVILFFLFTLNLLIFFITYFLFLWFLSHYFFQQFYFESLSIFRNQIIFQVTLHLFQFRLQW
jgi:hypothetical protein